MFVPKKGKRKSFLSPPWDFYCWFYLLLQCIWRHPHSFLFRQLRKAWFLQPFAPAHVFCWGSCYKNVFALCSKPFLQVRQQPHGTSWVWTLNLSSLVSTPPVHLQCKGHGVKNQPLCQWTKDGMDSKETSSSGTSWKQNCSGSTYDFFAFHLQSKISQCEAQYLLPFIFNEVLWCSVLIILIYFQMAINYFTCGGLGCHCTWGQPLIKMFQIVIPVTRKYSFRMVKPKHLYCVKPSWNPPSIKRKLKKSEKGKNICMDLF